MTSANHSPLPTSHSATNHRNHSPSHVQKNKLHQNANGKVADHINQNQAATRTFESLLHPNSANAKSKTPFLHDLPTFSSRAQTPQTERETQEKARTEERGRTEPLAKVFAINAVRAVERAVVAVVGSRLTRRERPSRACRGSRKRRPV